jgi:hypothetical protein
MAIALDKLPKGTFKALTGSCGCGKLRYRLDAPPFQVNACHCRYCQRETGATHGLNYGIESEHLTITAGDEDKMEVTIPSESGKGQLMYASLWG